MRGIWAERRDRERENSTLSGEADVEQRGVRVLEARPYERYVGLHVDGDAIPEKRCRATDRRPSPTHPENLEPQRLPRVSSDLKEYLRQNVVWQSVDGGLASRGNRRIGRERLEADRFLFPPRHPRPFLSTLVIRDHGLWVRYA